MDAQTLASKAAQALTDATAGLSTARRNASPARRVSRSRSKTPAAGRCAGTKRRADPNSLMARRTARSR